ncbi:Microspherule protein 1 [Tritrichomonas musculus]|uniref:Microspherule protein 1 n=1 Tax=Tritrichomonas musculus TaxID=1915356 RepID=A0ABR2JYE3_9EUKA
MNKDEENEQINFKIEPPLKQAVHRTPFTVQSQEALYFGILSCVPINMLQLIPPLQNYSLHEIEYYLLEFMQNPPVVQLDSIFQNFPAIPFDIDEDFAIATMIRSNTGPFSFDFITKFLFLFKPIRTIKQINERYEQLKNLPSEELEKIYHQFAEKTYKEYLSYQSIRKDKSRFMQSGLIFDICTLSREIAPEIIITHEIDSEIDRLGTHRKLFLKNHFSLNDLAILRTEQFEFFMKQTSIIIGRNTDTNIVDVDLNYFIQPGCKHISKKQAILFFQNYNDEYYFFIENIGKRCFRVNGALVPKGKICILQSGSIIDFSDILIMFVSNEDLIEKIKQNIRHHEMAKPFIKKRKKRELQNK